MNPRVAHALSKLNRPYFPELINELGDAEHLTIVVGAGISVDAGLPDWMALVRTMLENGFVGETRSLVDKSSYEALAKDVLSTSDVMQAATIARFLHDDRPAAIRSALYEKQPSPLRPGRIARALAHMCRIFDGQIRFITTNYDDLLEEALRIDGALRPSPRYVASDGSIELVPGYDDGTVEIIHLHGFIPRLGNSSYGGLILDERDFAIEPVRPPGPVLPKLLSRDEPTLFLGLSFTDPNLVAACYNLPVAANSRPPWHGLFVNFRDDAASVEDYKFERIRELGVRPFKLASFGQVSQVLYEIAHRAVYGGAEYWDDDSGRRYGLRLTRWRQRFELEHRGLLGGDHFEERQQHIHEELSALLEDLTKGELHELRPGENLGVHLWARRPGDEAGLGWLQLLGSSSNRHREPWSLNVRTEPVRGGSKSVAVRSLFYGGVQRRDEADTSGRWSSTIAAPIDLVDSPNDFLLAGVVTLSSTASIASSVLRNHGAEAIGRLRGLVAPLVL
jgi:hypothetical protein